jgi:D-alanyl-D-alanine carboxypeptidase
MLNDAAARFARLVLCVVLCASLTGLGSANDASAANATLEDQLRMDLSDYLSTRSSIEHISTLSMTIGSPSIPDINLAVGTTKYGGASAVTPSNLFQTGSNTKAFTSALILQLEASGALSIEDTLGKWLPQYPAWSSVTIRQLLNMTSGIATYDNTPAQIADYDDNPLEESTLSQLAGYVYPDIKTPGAAWLYSNTGYILLEMIVDKASASHDYRTELDALIAKTGLRNTYYEPFFYPPAEMDRLVSGYYVNTDPPVLTKLLGTDTSAYSLGWAQAAGGMVSTPEDLTLWVRALFEAHVLPPAQLAELESLVAIPTATAITQTSSAHPQGFGLGIFQLTDPALGRFWGYSGSTIGYRAAYAYFPASRLIICVFTNSQTTAKLSTINTVLFKTLYETLKANGRV